MKGLLPGATCRAATFAYRDGSVPSDQKITSSNATYVTYLRKSMGRILIIFPMCVAEYATFAAIKIHP